LYEDNWREIFSEVAPVRNFVPPQETDSGATPAAGGERRSRFAKVPSEYAVHLLIEGGHREEVRFQKLEEFTQWYQTAIKPKAESNEFVGVPMKTAQGEMMVVRPSKINGIRVEPLYTTSVDRY
jgi:hypothetical protein